LDSDDADEMQFQGVVMEQLRTQMEAIQRDIDIQLGNITSSHQNDEESIRNKGQAFAEAGVNVDSVELSGMGKAVFKGFTEKHFATEFRGLAEIANALIDFARDVIKEFSTSYASLFVDDGVFDSITGASAYCSERAFAILSDVYSTSSTANVLLSPRAHLAFAYYLKALTAEPIHPSQ